MPSPLLPIAPAARSTKHPINLLVWHDVVPDGEKLVWFDTGVAELRRQFDILTRAGAKPIPLDVLFDYLATGRGAVPPGAVVLCFDDNTRGIYEYAFPELARRGWHFAVSAHSKYVGVTTGKPHNGWAELRAMEASGRARVVSQTHTHPPDLRLLSNSALRADLETAKQLHEKNLGRETRFLTYPSGKWDGRVALAALRAGYQMALTEDHGAAETSPHLLGVHRWSTHRRFVEAVAGVTASARPSAHAK